jgi:hypothetical protein
MFKFVVLFLVVLAMACGQSARAKVANQTALDRPVRGTVAVIPTASPDIVPSSAPVQIPSLANTGGNPPPSNFIPPTPFPVSTPPQSQPTATPVPPTPIPTPPGFYFRVTVDGVHPLSCVVSSVHGIYDCEDPATVPVLSITYRLGQIVSYLAAYVDLHSQKFFMLSGPVFLPVADGVPA